MARLHLDSNKLHVPFTQMRRDVREAAKAASLVDVKVVAFSDALTADKFVIPVASR